MTEKPKIISARRPEYWINKGYNEQEANILAKSKTPGTYEYYTIFKKFSHQDALDAKTKYSQNKGVTLINMIKRYGEELGTQKFNEYKQKQSYSNSYEYKKNKYQWTEEEFKNFNNGRAITLSNQIKKYGAELGTQKFNDYCIKQKDAGCSLSYFIGKYGEDEGLRIYTNLNVMKGHTFDTYMIRHNGDFEKATVAFSNFWKNKKISTSKPVNELFKILTEYSLYKQYEHIFCAEHIGEWYIHHKGESIIFLDFFVKDIGKVIEFYGDYWHCNPNKFAPDYFHKQTKKTGKEIWESDMRRIDLVKKMPYIKDVMIVWESDYMKNKEQIILQCKNFLNMK